MFSKQMECDRREMFGGGNGDVLRKAIDFEVIERGGRWRPKMAWRRKKVKWIEQNGIKKENSIDKPRRRNAVHKL